MIDERGIIMVGLAGTAVGILAGVLTIAGAAAGVPRVGVPDEIVGVIAATPVGELDNSGISVLDFCDGEASVIAGTCATTLAGIRSRSLTISSE